MYFILLACCIGIPKFLSSVVLMSLFYWVLTPCSFICSTALCHIKMSLFFSNHHLHGNLREFYVNILGRSAFSSETSVNFCKTTRRYILEDSILYNDHHQLHVPTTMSNPTGSSLVQNGWLLSTKWLQQLNMLSSTHEIVLHVQTKSLTVHTVVIWHFRHWNCSGV